MTLQYDVNNSDDGNGMAEFCYDLKQTLVAANWSVRSSSNGTVRTVGDSISSSTVFNNNNAWMILRAPVGMTPRREMMIQRGLSDRSCKVSWVMDGVGYTVAGSATVPDTSAVVGEESYVVGSAGAFSTTFFPTGGTYKYHIVADDASPYGWWGSCNPSGAGNANVIMVFDPLAAGSYSSGDLDPAIYYFSNVGSPFVTTQVGPQGKAWYKKGLAGASFVVMPGTWYTRSANVAIPGNLGTNPIDSVDNHFPIPWLRNSNDATQVGWKGFGTIIHWLGPTRSNCDTLSTGGIKDHIVFDNAVLPWPNVTPVV
jgi:hypothetical protein